MLDKLLFIFRHSQDQALFRSTILLRPERINRQIVESIFDSVVHHYSFTIIRALSFDPYLP